jgi:hypothetical protein
VSGLAGVTFVVYIKKELAMADMKVPDNQGVISKKDLFLSKYREKYPDLPENDEEAFYGSLSGDFDRFDRSETAQRELGDLLASDPRSAGFLMVMRNGGNPLEFLIEQYGDDFREALNDEEKAKELSSAFSKYLEKQTKDRELQKLADENMTSMVDAIERVQQEGGYTDEEMADAYQYLYGEGGLLDRIITNGVSAEDWLMLLKASRFEKAVEEARAEGEIAGRNQNIQLNKRKATEARNMPSDISSQSGKTVAAKPQNEALTMLDNITSRKSVFDNE